MKQFKFLAYMFFIGAGLMITSCEEDGGLIEPPGTGTDGPSVTISDVTGGDLEDFVVEPSSTFDVWVAAKKTERDMAVFTIKEDGVPIDLTRVFINDTPDNNPTTLFNSEVDSFTWKVSVIAHDDVAFRTYTYEVTDDEQNIGSASINVDTDTSNGGGGGGDTPPVVSVFGSAVVENLTANSTQTIRITASPANGVLASIAVFQDGAAVDPSRLDFAGNAFDANPYSFPEAYQMGFVDESLFVRIQDSGSAVYRIVITDEFGNNSEVTKTFSVVTTPTGTPVEEDTGILLNQAGPAGTGGLDLDTGNSTGSSDAAAEIVDMGIDGGPVATNWLQQISGVNGSTVRQLVPGQNGLLETFTFGGVAFVEELPDVHSFGASLNGGVSNTVLVGDMFSVENNGNYYLLLVTNINNTTDDNNDGYTFSLKR